MKNTMRRNLQTMTALLAFMLFFFARSMPACAEESIETEELPVEVTQEEMDEAYDEAMMQVDSEITFLTMKEVNYRLADIMKFASGKMSDKEFAEMKNPDIERLLDLGELIELSDSFFKEAEMQTDLSEYEDAVSAWKEYTQGLSGDPEATGADELFEHLPLKSRADFLEAAYHVDNAVWTALKNELGASLSGMTDLAPDVSIGLKQGAEAVSSFFSVIDEAKTYLSVGTDHERYEKRIALQKIKTRFTLLQQMLLVVCNVIEAVPSF
ncbi:MAG: hypothetical protein IKE58_09035 [Blautia sp.]|nr:hypothetical protein [Blautia sp.]